MASSHWNGNMQPRIFLIGFMGSGKSTLGSRLAKRIGYLHVDMDQLIEETAGMTIPGIFRDYGEEVFRKWEKDILLELCQREQVVISTGGGAPCHHDLISEMNRNGTTLYLALPPEVLKERLLRSKTERPLLIGKSEAELMDYITRKLEEREPFYRKARYTISGMNIDMQELVALLQQ
jgi:shikimate kinase